MANLPAIVSSEGYVPGVNGPEQMICQYLHMTNSMGCSWFGCDISAFSLPLLMLQLSIIFFVTHTVFFFLKPLRQSILSCQLIGCIVFIWLIRLNKNLLNQLFPESGRLVLDTVAEFGFLLHVFVVGVQIDTNILKSVERHMVLMGCLSFFVPYVVCCLCLMPLTNMVTIDEFSFKTLPFVAALTSLTSFPAVTTTLSDLNLLNCDLGRLSCSTALVTDVCSYVTTLALSTIGVALERSDWKPLNNILWIACFLLSIIYILRPFVLWMAKRIPEGQQIKESQFLVVLVALLLCGFLSECLGQAAEFGGFTMGVCVPDGPPFGLALVNRIDWMATAILVPAKFAIAAFKAVTEQAYSLLILNMLIVTGSIRLLLGHFYDPSTRYQTYKRNSILECEPDDYLRMLICIHNEDNVPSMINLLEASNPTQHQPIEVISMNLQPLEGRASAILVPSSKVGEFPSAQTRMLQIIKAYNNFIEHKKGSVIVEHFMALAPYGSMHEDIFTIALNKCANIVIVPFHKHWAIDGSIEATFPGIRTVNYKLMEKTPCSVGILVDRGQIGGPKSVLKGPNKMCRITQLFLGGADDREALAYSSRMAQHPHIRLLLILLKPQCADIEPTPEMYEKKLDGEMIDRFRMECKGRNIFIQQQAAKDAVETVQLLKALEKDCDLFIVGREHGYCVSQLTYGLSEWSECPELGGLGDLLATSNFQFSVLVVQQQLVDTVDFAGEKLAFAK